MPDMALTGRDGAVGRERGRPRPLLRTLLGDALRRNRLAQRRTLADVARRARVSVPYLSEVERGRKEASSEVLAAVCGALRIELADLLAEAGRKLVRDDTSVVSLAAARRQREATAARGPGATTVGQRGEASVARRRSDAATVRRRSGDVVLLAA